MLMDKNELRIAIDRMARTRIAVEKSEMFDQNNWMLECGTPGCWLGHGTVAVPEALKAKGLLVIIETETGLQRDFEEAAAVVYRLPLWLAQWMTSWRYVSLKFHMTEDKHRAMGIAIRSKREQMRIIKMVENYYRRRLAILEAETDEWGKQFKANEVPVGRNHNEILVGAEI